MVWIDIRVSMQLLWRVLILFEMDDVDVGSIMLPVQETESPRTP